MSLKGGYAFRSIRSCMGKDKKIEEVKEKFGDTVENIGEKIEQISDKIGSAVGVEGKNKKMKALVTSRVLFISILDKLYLISFVLAFVIMTYVTFAGDLSSMYYGFWGRLGTYIIELIVFVIMYFFYNWLYKCSAKTMLCLTKNEIYKEQYIPFKKTEINIPLEKVTKASTIDFFWIFRVLVIHQYHQLPMIFWTWNNHEFKDKLNELITGDKEKVENEFEDKNIIPKSLYKYLKFFALGVGILVLLIGVGRLFGYMFGPFKNIPGTYSYDDKQIVLNEGGSCSIIGFVDNVTSCSWDYNEETSNIVVNYDYDYKSWYSTYSRSATMYLNYEKDTKTIVYNENTYTK